MADGTDRRCFLARGVAGAAGLTAASFTSIEENTLRAAEADGTTAAAAAKGPKIDVDPSSMPTGKIGNISMSRLIIGGNLIGGFAHSRDLMYISALFKAYNTPAKIYETLDLAQACGINTIQVSPKAWDTVLDYNKTRQAKFQIMSNPPLLADRAAMKEEIKRMIDLGITLIYTHGGSTDSHFMKGGSIDVLAQAVELIREQGVPAGVGSHSLEVPKACVQNKIDPDYYVKTFHMDRYWSATPKESRKEYDWMQRQGDHDANYDGMWCNNPEETIAFMEKIQKPWVAFKVMAAGAIQPKTAFSYAYRNGADFVVAGMFDFQVEADAKIAIERVRKSADRPRPWYS